MLITATRSIGGRHTAANELGPRSRTSSTARTVAARRAATRASTSSLSVTTTLGDDPIESFDVDGEHGTVHFERRPTRLAATVGHFTALGHDDPDRPARRSADFGVVERDCGERDGVRHPLLLVRARQAGEATPHDQRAALAAARDDRPHPDRPEPGVGRRLAQLGRQSEQVGEVVRLAALERERPRRQRIVDREVVSGERPLTDE